MKKIVSSLLICVMLVGTLFTLASCTVVNGKYASGDTTVEFSMFGNVTITYETELFGAKVTKTFEAKYSIQENEDGNLEISFEYDDDAEKHVWLSGTKSFTKGSDNNGKYVEIGGVRYDKQ